MKRPDCHLPDSLYEALLGRMQADKTSCDHVVSTALSECLGEPLHTLFQVSTSAALVEGLYQDAVQVVRLLSHGDFGLGTFIDLDGEMVVVDGVYYQVSSGGKVSQVEGDRLIPYAVVTRFNAEFSEKHPELSNFAELVAVCDELRDSENMVWIDGTYDIVAVQEQPKYKRTSGVDFWARRCCEVCRGFWSDWPYGRCSRSNRADAQEGV